MSITLTAEQSAATTDRPVTCLSCLQPVALAVSDKGKTLTTVAAHRYDDKNFVDCRGSGYVPVQNDGRDDVRVYAINQQRQLLIEAAEVRTEVQGYLSKGYAFDSITDMSGAALARLEVQASVWNTLAKDGDWWKTLTYVLSMLCREHCGANTAEGYRQWLFGVKTDLARMAETSGQEDLANLLVGI